MQAGDKRVAELLISRGVDINAGALINAIYFGHNELVELLIAEGADVNEHSERWRGFTPLHWAAQRGYEENAKTLLTAGAKIRLCRQTRSGLERLFFRLAASGCIDDKTNIACFAVFARRKKPLALGPTMEFSDKA